MHTPSNKVLPSYPCRVSFKTFLFLHFFPKVHDKQNYTFTFIQQETKVAQYSSITRQLHYETPPTLHKHDQKLHQSDSEYFCPHILAFKTRPANAKIYSTLLNSLLNC